MDNVITWNVRNWLTVFLMFLSAWVVLGLGVRMFKGRRASVPLASDGSTPER